MHYLVANFSKFYKNPRMKSTLFVTFAICVICVVSSKSNFDISTSNVKSLKSNVKSFESDKMYSITAVAPKAATTGGTSQIAPSVLNLAKTILGAGVLSLPSGIALFSDSKYALIPSSILLAFMGLASAYSFSSIGKACSLHGVSSFADAFAKSLNLNSGIFISSIVTFKTFFACLAYSIIIGDSFSQILSSIKSLPAVYTQRSNVILGLTSLVIFPLCLLKNLDALKYTSMAGIGGVVYCAVFMLLRYFDGSYKLGGKFYEVIDNTMRPSFNKKSGNLVS